MNNRKRQPGQLPLENFDLMMMSQQDYTTRPSLIEDIAYYYLEDLMAREGGRYVIS
jgi:hypothetical protein